MNCNDCIHIAVCYRRVGMTSDRYAEKCGDFESSRRNCDKCAMNGSGSKYCDNCKPSNSKGE